MVGMRVPALVVAVGDDDIGTLRDVYPPLTTVRLPLTRMGEMAAELVLSEAVERGQAASELGVVADAALARGDLGFTPAPGTKPDLD